MAELNEKDRMLLACISGEFNNQPYPERIRTADFMDGDAVRELLRERAHAAEAVRRIDARIASIMGSIRKRRTAGVLGTPNDQRQVREDSQGLEEPGRLSPTPSVPASHGSRTE